MSVMTVDGYSATIEYDAELDQFKGEILGLTGSADFYGKTPKELRSEFRKSLTVFLGVGRQKGIEPRRSDLALSHGMRLANALIGATASSGKQRC